MNSDYRIPPELSQSDWFNLVQAEREGAILQERRRFADELHDVVASTLQAAMLHLMEARQALPARKSPAVRAIEAAEEHVRTCWADARRCAAALRPVGLERRGLTGALSDYVTRLSEASGTQITFSTCGSPRALPEAAELALLRAGQEAVSNALRHASAEAISVELSYDADGVRLDVTDNGLGFDLRSTVPGSGLLAMRNRADDLGAELSILTEPTHGTEVIVSMPYEHLTQRCDPPLPSESHEMTRDAAAEASASTPIAAPDLFLG